MGLHPDTGAHYSGFRKPVLVELNSKSGFAVGVDIGRPDIPNAQTVLVITDLRGQIVHRLVRPHGLESLDRRLQDVEGMIQELLSTSPVDAKKIQGIAVGLPGIVDERAGTVRETSRQGLRTNYVAIRDQLDRRSHASTRCKIAACCYARGHQRRRARDTQFFRIE